MKSIKYIALSLAASAVALTSCSDSFLDKTPDERVDLTQVSDVVKLISSAYSTGNYGWLCEVSSDNIVDVNANYLATQSNGNEIMVRYNLNSYGRMDDEAYKFEPVKSSTDSDSPTSIWDGCYNAIATVNHALVVLDELKAKAAKQEGKSVEAYQMPEQMRAAYGEAYLSRAYHHFILVNVFSQAYKTDELSKNDAGIPYSESPEDKVLIHYDRGNVTDTYARIEEDLEKGLSMISDVNYTVAPKYHFNVSAAHAFAARFYLMKRNYEKVIEHADAVLGTDAAVLPTLLMDYSGFDDCTYSSDYANVWQDPKASNNLLLIATYSAQWRRHIGRRYATAGKALRDIEFHLGPNWRWYLMPAAGVGGGTFYDGDSGDHGYTSARIAEQFEYTDKVAGIGYAHIIRREFTNTMLLLERAEARLLGRNDIDGCVADLIAYEESRQSFSESNKAFYTSGGALSPLTRQLIDTYYANSSNSNCFENWDFTQNMGFTIPQELTVYMNAINDMRRYETAYTGLRFFDLKRFGIEYTHTYHQGPNGSDDVDYTLTWNDERRAIEIPQEVIAAGLEPSQKILVKQDGGYAVRYTEFPQKN